MKLPHPIPYQGSKRNIADQILRYFPDEFYRLIEPFAGSAALSSQQCASLARAARELGLEVLLEIHNPSELEHLNDYVNVVGVNNRDLTTFVTDTALSESLAAMIPDKFVKISESGISSPNTVKRLYDLGYDGFLIGETFMKHSDPAGALEQFIAEL